MAKAVEEQCAELLAADIIEPSKSPWSTPIVPIRKKDGTIRLCVDYRKLNEVTKPDRHPMPNVTDVISGLSGVRYFTTLDLVRGYYQMPIAEDSREFTAFSTPRGHWQFKRLPFGLKNAPSAFQREMQAVLEGFAWKKVMVYIDDILIMENSWEDHLNLLDKVLGTLIKNGIKVKPAKCCFGQRRVKFLGHIIGQDGVQKSSEYMDSISKYAKPTTVKGLREFLGLVNFQRKFIPRCSEVSKPLSELTGGKGSDAISWTAEMNHAFEELKQAAVKDIELAYPDFSEGAEPLELSVDASGYGAGACLSQWQNGQHRIIAYASMSFSAAQRRYSTTEREITAIRWGVKTLRSYLYGVQFVVYTDHRPLLYLNNMKLVDSRLARTLEDLADFSFTIKYRPGVQNKIADALSRLVPDEVLEESFSDPKEIPDGLRLLKKVDGGGDSLFESLLEVIKEETDIEINKDSTELRQELIDELLTNSKEYELRLDKQLKKDLKSMKYPGVLPVLEVILAFSNLYKVQVWMHSGSKPVIFDHFKGRSFSDYPRVHLQNLAGVHFNPLMECKKYKINVLRYLVEENKWRDLSPSSDESNQTKVDIDSEVLEDVAQLMSTNIIENESSLGCSHSGSSYYMSMRANGIPCCAVLDTGAEISILEESIWNQIPQSVRGDICIQAPVKTVLQGLGNNRYPVKGMAVLGLETGTHDLGRFPVAIVETGVLPCCLLLGQNFIKAKSLLLDFDRQEIQHHVDSGTCVIHSFHENPETTSSLWMGCIHFRAVDDTDQDSNGSEPEGSMEDLVEQYNKVKKRLNINDIVEIQKRDYIIRQVRKCVEAKNFKALKKSRAVKIFKKHASNLIVYNDCLWYRGNRKSKPVIPFKVLSGVVMDIHQTMAHIGSNKLKECVESQYWHPEIAKVCKDVAVTCGWCQKNKPCQRPILPPTFKIETKSPFELLAVDLVELPRSSSGHVGCLVAVDHFSKWLSLIPIRDKKAHTVVKAFEKNILPSLAKRPAKVLSDNGPEFRSGAFNDMLESYGIEHVLTTPYKPSSNGAVERVNRTVIQFLKALVDKGHHWDHEVTNAILVYNNTYHEEIGMTPSEKLLRESHDGVDSSALPSKQKAVWKKGDPKFLPYKKGTSVLKKKEYKGRLNANKFDIKFEGPYKVSKVQPNGVTYEIIDSNGKIIRAHHTQLREYKDPPGYLKSLVEESDSSSEESDDEVRLVWCFSDSSSSSDEEPEVKVKPPMESNHQSAFSKYVESVLQPLVEKSAKLARELKPKKKRKRFKRNQRSEQKLEEPVVDQVIQPDFNDSEIIMNPPGFWDEEEGPVFIPLPTIYEEPLVEDEIENWEVSEESAPSSSVSGDDSDASESPSIEEWADSMNKALDDSVKIIEEVALEVLKVDRSIQTSLPLHSTGVEFVPLSPGIRKTPVEAFSGVVEEVQLIRRLIDQNRLRSQARTRVLQRRKSVEGSFVGFDHEGQSPEVTAVPLVRFNLEGEERESFASPTFNDMRPHTRSQGRAMDLPNVQSKILERKEGP